MKAYQYLLGGLTSLSPVFLLCFVPPPSLSSQSQFIFDAFRDTSKGNQDTSRIKVDLLFLKISSVDSEHTDVSSFFLIDFYYSPSCLSIKKKTNSLTALLAWSPSLGDHFPDTRASG